MTASTAPHSAPVKTQASRPERMELGYVVIGPAKDGNEAVELAREHHPDLALLDIRMPGRDGIDSGEEISQMGVPVIMVSAFSDPDYLRACNGFRTFGYLLKPVTQDELRVTIEIAWGRWLDSRAQQDDVDRLKARLEDRKIIEQAKWILVSRKSVSEPEAMRLLQRQARNNRRPLVEVAKGLVENEELLG